METLIYQEKESWLLWFLRGVLFLGLIVLIGRLLDLQIIRGSYFRSLADNNRIRRIPIPAPRGEILARGGEELAGSKEVGVKIVFLPDGEIKKVYGDGKASEDTFLEWVRTYPLAEAAGHITGYVGEVSADEVGKVDARCPGKGPRVIGSLVGRSGLEEEYDCLLRGIPGEELVEVDTQGKRVRTIGRKDPVKGKNIKTTLDAGLIVKVSELMKDKKGAVVVMDTKGELLAIESFPGYDPNLFIDQTPTEAGKVQKIITDPNLPVFNRAIGGLYHPGSIFKIVTAVGALEEGKIDKDFIYDDPGVIKINEFSYTNWYFTQYGRTEGKITVTKAIARSTDTFFYKVGEFLGVNALSEWANKFGLGDGTGIDLPGEATNLIPTPEWKERVKGEKWFLGNTYHMAIGQGDVVITPIAATLPASVIASSGFLCQPHILERDNTCRDLRISEETLDLVKEGMKGACSQGGTGYPFFDFQPGVACKTGTAETEEKDKTHAWLTLFAPIESPEIVITVLVEKGGEGSQVAAPIAKDIVNYWFHERNLQ